MSSNFTLEQQAAADFRGKRLLVSAAAGSGKTRVLVGRVIDRIERDRLDLEDFLVITFTRAAAAELRDRFGSELGRRAAETGDRHLRRQTTASKRNITTIDALCAMIVREYAHLVDIAGFRIASEGELERMRAEARSAALERIYSLDEGDILALREALSYGRADKKLADAVEHMHDHMRAHPFPEVWTAKIIAEYSGDDFGDTGFGAELSAAAERIVSGGVMVLEKAVALMEDDEEIKKAYGKAFDDDLACARGALSALAAHDLPAASVLLERGDARLGALRDRADDPLKDRVKALRDTWKASKKRAAKLLARSEDCTDELRALLPAVRGLIRAAEIFGEEYSRIKSARRAAEFDDYAHATVKLLAAPLPDGTCAPSEIARSVGSRYREVLVDEFQDTNEIQTFICDMLTAGSDSTLLMVGDVKQSIYRFRLARPEIFLERYYAYPKLEEGGSDARQSLTRNFRSRAEVLESANYFFRRMMTGGAAEIDYDDAQRLYPGREDAAGPAFDTELCVIDGAASDDEHITSLDANSREAAYVASRACEMLNGGLLIPDGSGGTRPLRPDDIAVLLRAASGRAWMYRQAFENLGIPCNSAGEDGMSAELLTLLAVLTAVDNPYLDVPLVGAMLSPVFGFSADEVALIRASARNERTIYGSVLCAARNGSARAAEFVEKLEALRREAGRTSPDRFILHLYAESGMVGIYSALPGGAGRRERLNLAYLKARSYSRESRYGLHGFIEYLEAAIERGEIASEGMTGGGVNIMSVHKSKGLEFAVVFYSALSNKFVFDDTRGDVLIHPDLGVGLKICDRARHYVYPSGAWCALSERLKRETLAEELRILYVAMTRAREKLILTCAFGSAEKKIAKLLDVGYLGDASFVSALSPAEWVISLAAEHPDGAALRAIAGSDTIDPYAEGRIKVRIVSMVRSDGRVVGERMPSDAADAPPEEELIAELERNLSFRYPAEPLREMPSKLTATQLRGLRGGDEDEDTELVGDETEEAADPSARRFAFQAKRPRLITEQTALTPTERGTAIHTVMQFARFEALGTREGALAEVDRLEQEKFVTPEQAASVRSEADKLCAFAKSDLCRRALASDRLYREFKFSILDDASRYYPEALEGEKVLLQGVCDMFFEEDGEMTVVDFKSDRVSPAGEYEHAQGYAPQLDAYARALERIYKKPVKRCLVYFFATGHEVEVRRL